MHVSSGFEYMTSYFDKFTLEKAIEQRKFVDYVLTNFHKNKESCLHKVEIFPIFNEKKELVNFAALESEIYA